MKRSIAFTIALAVSLFSLSLLSSDSTARAQKQNKSTWDTGVVTLGPNQLLRITVVNRGKADSGVRFGKTEYSQGACNGGVCKLEIINEQGTPAITLSPGEAASMDIPNTSFGVRGTAFTAGDDLWIVMQIVETTTGKVVSTAPLEAANAGTYG